VLRAAVCYYGSHYLAYCVADNGQWTRFDDTTVAVVATWEIFKLACAKGHLQARPMAAFVCEEPPSHSHCPPPSQPTTLFYERELEH